MDAVQTGKPPESQTHVTFETAAEHATPRVPVAGPFQRVGDVREHLIGQRYESASHIVVCEADTFLGIVTIEELLLASADAKMESLMDRGAPIVAPAVDQEVAAWRAVRHGESALAVVDGHGHFVGMIPPHRLLGVLLSEHEEDLARSAGFLKTTSVARTASEEPVHRRFQSRRARVVVEQPTETLAPTNATDTPLRWRTLNQFVAQPLMIPLAMIVGDKFGDGPSKMALAERNQPIETFLFDRADEAFGVGVRIRRPIRRLDDAEPGVLQARADRLTPLRVPVADQHAIPTGRRPA